MLPQLGSVALQAGEHAGENVAQRSSPARPTEPFAYKDKGTMATIGRGAAVVQFRRRPHDEGARRAFWPGVPCTSRCSRPTRTAPRR